MGPTILALLTILCSVGVNLGDETEQHVHHHRVTGQPTYVTRIHRYTHQQPGQGGGNGGVGIQGSQDVGGQTVQGEPQQQAHVHRVTGKYVTRIHRYTVPGQQQQHPGKQQQHPQTLQENTSSQGPSSHDVYEEISESSSADVYEEISESSSTDVYEEISESSYQETSSSGSYSSVIYEESSGPSSEEIYEEISGGPTSQDVYEKISGRSSIGSYEEISKDVVQVSQGAQPATGVSQVAPELRSNYDPTLKNGGYSYEGAFGVNQRRRCNRGLIDKAATGIRNTVNGGVDNLMGAISSLTNSGTALGPVGGLVNAVGHAGGHLIQGKLNEIDFMINDAACGLGNIANAAADMVKTGDVIGGVGTIGKELLGGVGNMGEDFLSQAASGIGNAANDILGFLGG